MNGQQNIDKKLTVNRIFSAPSKKKINWILACTLHHSTNKNSTSYFIFIRAWANEYDWLSNSIVHCFVLLFCMTPFYSSNILRMLKAAESVSWTNHRCFDFVLNWVTGNTLTLSHCIDQVCIIIIKFPWSFTVPHFVSRHYKIYLTDVEIEFRNVYFLPLFRNFPRVYFSASFRSKRRWNFSKRRLCSFTIFGRYCNARRCCSYIRKLKFFKWIKKQSTMPKE